MRKTITLLTILLFVVFMVGCENAINPTQPQTQNDNEGISLAKGKPVKYECNTIQSGLIAAEDGTTLETGYDVYGYNYQAHLFNGYYGNSSRPTVPVDGGTKLVMKWNDTWISNQDCGTMDAVTGVYTDPFTPDGKLDRHYGYDSYIGSGAWETNHQSGEYYFSDFVDIGLEASEAGHNLIGWGDVWNLDGSSGWGGHAGDLRVVWEPGGNEDAKEASLTMTSKGKNKEIIIKHLDGFADDGFELFINEELIGTYVDDYSSETWVETAFSIPKKISNSHNIVVKIVATGDAWSGQGTYGQLAVDYIELTTDKKCEWNYFVKIVAAPADAYKEGGNWVNAGGVVIGPIIWGSFAIIQQVYNDPCDGYHGLLYLSPTRAGFGNW